MKYNKKQKLLAAILAVAMIGGIYCGNLEITSAADSPPMTGSEARKANQPKFSGYRVWDIRNWTPEADPGAEFYCSKVPLQSRITPFQPTQANPDLTSDAKIMLMQGDYGNSFMDSMAYNNTFNYHTLNFWQYIDYFVTGHGSATAAMPEDLHDPDYEGSSDFGWERRYFEFGVLNIPNPAYTNAAHRNGVRSIASINFDGYYRQGQNVNELFVQDEDGTFPVAEKLIEMANYFRYDGYFFDAGDDVVEGRYEIPKKKFLARLSEAGLWTTYKDDNSSMDADKNSWLTDTDGSTIQNSVIVNFDWPSSLDDEGKNFKYLTNHPEINPFDQVFYGIENNQGEFNGGHPSAKSDSITQLYAPDSKNPQAGIALFDPSGFYQRGSGITNDMLKNPDSQWKIAERERMFFSGVTSDPTDTGAHPGYKNTAVGISDASDWVGVADFASERSVIEGTTFYTNFNVGKGMQYFTDGEVTGDEAWTNITAQNILPTWQWWIETPEATRMNATQPQEATGAIASVMPNEATAPVARADATLPKLKADFDYGTKYHTEATRFQPVGAYNGGSSLVVTGNLATDNLLRLYQTGLGVTASSTLDVTFQKSSATDTSEMKLALIFQDAPETVEYIPIPDSNKQTSEWITKSIDLSSYQDRKIATIGLSFTNGGTPVESYQMNIGQIRLTDGRNLTPNTPTDFRVDRAFTSDEMIVRWTIGSYDEVDNYEIYGTLSNGKRIFLGSTFDNIHYIKSLMNESKFVELELVAIGKDGSRSEPATVTYTYDDKVSDLSVQEVTKEVVVKPDAVVKGHVTEAKESGILELSWKNPSTSYRELRIVVTIDDSADTSAIVTTVPKGVTRTQVPVPKGHGERYQVAVYTIATSGVLSDPICLTGKLKDSYVAPYDGGKVSVSGKDVTFWNPDPNDWFKLHATVNGQTVTFRNQFDNTRFTVDNAIRAATLMTAELPTESGVIRVVLEDYSGNFSEPTLIPYGSDTEITADLVPDPTLLSAIQTQVGTTVSEAASYTGDLDLSGVEITDYTGLNLFGSAGTLKLGGAEVTEIKPDMLAGSFEKLDLTGCPNLASINAGSFKKFVNVKSLDLTGCTALTSINVADSNLETISFGDASTFTALVSADLSGAKLDMTPGTPERTLVDSIAARGADSSALKYNRQRPEVTVTYPEDLTLESEQGIINAQALKSFKTARGTDCTTLVGADFIDTGYNLQAKLDALDEIVRVTDQNSGVVTVNRIDTSKSTAYQVEYVSYNSAGAEGTVKKSITVTVGAGGIVIPTDKTVTLDLQAVGRGLIAVEFDGRSQLTPYSPLTFTLDKSSQPQTLTLWGKNDSDSETIIKALSIQGNGSITKTERVADENGKSVNKYTLSLIPSTNLNILLDTDLPRINTLPNPIPNVALLISDDSSSSVLLPETLPADIQSMAVTFAQLTPDSPIAQDLAKQKVGAVPVAAWDLNAQYTTTAGETFPHNGLLFTLDAAALPALEKNQVYTLYHLTRSGWKQMPSVQVSGTKVVFATNDGYSPFVLCVEERQEKPNSSNSSNNSSSNSAVNKVVLPFGPAPLLTIRQENGQTVLASAPKTGTTPLTAEQIADLAKNGTLDSTVNPNGVWNGTTTGANNVALVVDTKTINMQPGDLVNFGISAFTGNGSQTLRAAATRGGYVDLLTNADGTFTVKAIRPVDRLYIRIDILDAKGEVIGHASIQVNIAPGNKKVITPNQAATIA